MRSCALNLLASGFFIAGRVVPSTAYVRVPFAKCHRRVGKRSFETCTKDDRIAPVVHGPRLGRVDRSCGAVRF
jgi:hypothetical protein